MARPHAAALLVASQAHAEAHAHAPRAHPSCRRVRDSRALGSCLSASAMSGPSPNESPSCSWLTARMTWPLPSPVARAGQYICDKTAPIDVRKHVAVSWLRQVSAFTENTAKRKREMVKPVKHLALWVGRGRLHVAARRSPSRACHHAVVLAPEVRDFSWSAVPRDSKTAAFDLIQQSTSSPTCRSKRHLPWYIVLRLLLSKLY